MFLYLTTWFRIKSDRRAVTALEYALLASVIVAVIMVGFGQLGSSLSATFSRIAASL